MVSDEIVRVAVLMPRKLYEEIRVLVGTGRYSNISEVVRAAVRDLLVKELSGRERLEEGGGV